MNIVELKRPNVLSDEQVKAIEDLEDLIIRLKNGEIKGVASTAISFQNEAYYYRHWEYGGKLELLGAMFNHAQVMGNDADIVPADRATLLPEDEE